MILVIIRIKEHTIYTSNKTSAYNIIHCILFSILEQKNLEVYLFRFNSFDVEGAVFIKMSSVAR